MPTSFNQFFHRFENVSLIMSKRITQNFEFRPNAKIGTGYMFSEIDRMNNSYQPKVIAVSYKSVIIAGHIDINTNMY